MHINRRPSEAQQAATMRNWGIRQLRALYGLTGSLSADRRRQVQAIIDEELADRGAEPEGERQRRARAEAQARLDAEFPEIPF